MLRISRGVMLVSTLFIACGGSQPPAEDPPTESVPEAAEASPPPSEEVKSEEAAAAPAEKQAAPVAEPVFTDNMSVAEATKAVPQGAERRNIEQEALAKPLQDPKLLEACKVGSARFNVKVAVWDGRAVGIDLTTTPKNPKLSECLTQKIKEITWPDKVKSLNTVEFQY